MPATLCQKHGKQIALVFCAHAMEAIDNLRPMDVYLQHDQYGWATLCEDCARRLPESMAEANELGCSGCVMEWVRATGTDYQQRANNPVNEYPPDHA